MKKDTILIHGGKTTDEATGAVNIPIYQTSTFAQSALGVHKGYEYARTKNPTRDGVESLLAEIENAKFGFAFSSGMAAIATILALFKSGDTLLVSNNVYGGTFRILDKVFNQFNINYVLVDTANMEAVRFSMKASVKAIFIESPTNPLMSISPLEKIAKFAKENGILSIVDNTFMSPYLQNPLDFGIDIVVHSCTKYLGGHSDLLAGAIMLNDEELATHLSFLQNSIGAVLSPFDSFLLIRGIKTLGLRMQRHSENALIIAEFLEKHRAIERVFYPGLKNFEGYSLHKEQARSGGGMMSFVLKGEINYDMFCKSTKIITLGESLGGVESLLNHPVSMTHASLGEKMCIELGITKELFRLSVGVEDVQDLIEDLDNALKVARV